jgi:large subunit ribosomal protein L30
MPQIKITQYRSKIRCIEKHKRTLEALGLRRVNHTVIHEDTPQIRGMVAQVTYLVHVDPALGGAATKAKSTKAKAAKKAKSPESKAAKKAMR